MNAISFKLIEKNLTDQTKFIFSEIKKIKNYFIEEITQKNHALKIKQICYCL